jgi:hypothetical protein
VADAVEEELEYEPQLDARLAGCDRRTLQPDPSKGAFLCYVAGAPALNAQELSQFSDVSARDWNCLIARQHELGGAAELGA